MLQTRYELRAVIWEARIRRNLQDQPSTRSCAAFRIIVQHDGTLVAEQMDCTDLLHAQGGGDSGAVLSPSEAAAIQLE
ncbi:hypothetical protein NDU88_006203 [Pleurodeles waltl]|uniref:Uncharacterized protein n=1 Tax=Pleurodeles waltl TaxID=8319 RepID=A0AAV7WE05_PLEWA|nr:hypothetical protein NDU88_006203 [Pleurodeles waltl]